MRRTRRPSDVAWSSIGEEPCLLSNRLHKLPLREVVGAFSPARTHVNCRCYHQLSPTGCRITMLIAPRTTAMATTMRRLPIRLSLPHHPREPLGPLGQRKRAGSSSLLRISRQDFGCSWRICARLRWETNRLPARVPTGGGSTAIRLATSTRFARRPQTALDRGPLRSSTAVPQKR